ncbi:MAG: Uma2 family endonuclease [Eubacteriaceae bacterium]|jgi:hypothetical protein
MENRLLIKDGSLTTPPDNCDLINGNAVQRPQQDERITTVLTRLQQIAQKFKLTNKPLDTVHGQFEKYEFPGTPKTVLFPAFSVSKKNSVDPDWVADFVTGNTDPIAFGVKPWIYKEAGVTEYWVIDAEKKKLYLYNFNKNGLVPEIIDSPRRIKAGIYNGLYVSYSDLFAEQN